MEPTFPLRTAPTCHQCGEPCTRHDTSPFNENGNAGRPYYICMDSGHYRKFSTFDDSRGVVRGNPQCSCGYMSRRCRRNGLDRGEFYCCPVGGCTWFGEVPATTARPAVGSDGNWSRETTPETHTVVVGVGCSYVEDSPAPEVASEQPTMAERVLQLDSLDLEGIESLEQHEKVDKLYQLGVARDIGLPQVRSPVLTAPILFIDQVKC